MANNRLRCTPDNRFCQSFDARRRPAVITEELLGKIAAAGVGCKGELAEYLKHKGACGIPGAIMDARSWQLIQAGNKADFDSELEVMRQILEGEVEPCHVITNPPGILHPNSKAQPQS